VIAPAPLGTLALFALLFTLYALGSCRSIYVGDSGELVTAVHTLGIPHPSGYPLYVLLGKLWSELLPLGSVAWRMSLFSCVCAAAACSALYAVGRRLRLAPIAALFAALVLGFSPSFWSQANVQRVYALGAPAAASSPRLPLVIGGSYRTSSGKRGFYSLATTGVGASLGYGGSVPPVVGGWGPTGFVGAIAVWLALRVWRRL